MVHTDLLWLLITASAALQAAFLYVSSASSLTAGVAANGAPTRYSQPFLLKHPLQLGNRRLCCAVLPNRYRTTVLFPSTRSQRHAHPSDTVTSASRPDTLCLLRTIIIIIVVVCSFGSVLNTILGLNSANKNTVSNHTIS